MVLNKSDKEVIKLIDNFFVKSTSLICAAKSNKYQLSNDLPSLFDEEWLLSETNEDLELPEIIYQWSQFDGEKDLPPLVIETYLDLRQVGPSQWITLKDDDENSWNVCKGTKKTEIVLERWLIELDNSSASFKNHKPTLEESTDLSSQLILLFRYLYTLIQLLPANDLHVSLSKFSDTQGSMPVIQISTRVLDGSKPILSKGRIGLSKPIISTYSNVINESNVPSHLEQRKITPVWTKYGLLRISVSYRHDCHFEIHDSDEEYASNQFISEPAVKRLTTNRSPSLSPQAHAGSLSSMERPPSQRRPVAISRQLQVFKVGSVGSVPTYQSQTLTRNPSSSSSVVANLQAQRTNNSPSLQPQDTPIEGTSVGSASKYSSSFGRIRRHSSTKQAEQNERPSRPTKQSEDQSDTLLEFVKMIDEKPDLKFNKNRSKTVDISNSLMKFQSLRPTNDFISENLSLSASLDPSHASQRRRSSSHSPMPSFSPAINYPSIPSRFSQADLTEDAGEYQRSSTETHKPGGASLHGSSVSSQRLSAGRKSSFQYSAVPSSEIVTSNDNKNEKYDDDDDDNDDDDELLMHRADLDKSESKKYTSPMSVESVTSSIPRNRLPIPQPSQYSQPTTIAVPAYAKLHRPGADVTEPPAPERRRSSDGGLGHEDDEDEDLLFFMSDMNLSKM